MSVTLFEGLDEYLAELRVPAPKGWVCSECGEGDIPSHPAERIDISTASGKHNRILPWVHVDCAHKAWDRSWGERGW